jgi:Fe-S-cluster containining protein
LGRFLLALHDTYVLGRNRDILPLKEELQEESTCRRCGLCCIGPAEGPISTSPADLSRWDAMGRDDLLYFTRFGPAGALRARSLEFPCCPFLRFSAKKKNGHCLVHPVKPLVCRQFVCG